MDSCGTGDAEISRTNGGGEGGEGLFEGEFYGIIVSNFDILEDGFRVAFEAAEKLLPDFVGFAGVAVAVGVFGVPPALYVKFYCFGIEISAVVKFNAGSQFESPDFAVPVSRPRGRQIGLKFGSSWLEFQQAIVDLALYNDGVAVGDIARF